MLPMKIAGIRRSERKQRALAAREQLEMADKATSKALNLSGGQKQRSVIAVLAASFGIVNTLFMSVQERTREIGLMKAMGMGSRKVFGLFSLEAVFIGFLGSAIGVGIGMIVGTAIISLLAGAILADLPGLTLIAFDPISVAVIILVVMAIAFLAGTIPAARAARADPVESLRYE